MRKPICGSVYRIINTANGKSYIGQTIRPVATRFAAHLRYRGNYTYLKGAINKYGKSAFAVTTLVTNIADRALLGAIEVAYITAYQSTNPLYGYNLRSGGEHPTTAESTKAKLSAANRGKKHSPEAKAKVSAANRGKKLSPEHKAKISTALRGKECSAETKESISAALRGIKRSPETKAKVSAANRGRRLSPEHKAKTSAGLLAYHAANPTATSGENHSQFGKKQSPERKAKTSAALRGIKRSPETKAKVSAAKLAYYAAKRAANQPQEVKLCA